MQQTVTLIGYLTNDPQLKSFHSGSRLTRFRIGASRKVRKPSSAYAESGWDSLEEEHEYIDRDRLFIDVECWGNLAENTHVSLMKGKPVICVGYLNTQKWQDNAGNSQSKVVLRAIFVGFELRNHVVNYRRNPLPIKTVEGADLSKYNAPIEPSENQPVSAITEPINHPQNTVPGVEVVELKDVQPPAGNQPDQAAAAL